MQLRRSDLADLSYFLEIARHRSFRRAGLELGVSASASSHAVEPCRKTGSPSASPPTSAGSWSPRRPTWSASARRPIRPTCRPTAASESGSATRGRWAPIEREFFDFYRTPRGEFTPEGSSPLLTTHPMLSEIVKFSNFYPFEDIETISPRPMLFVTGDEARSREFSEDAYARAAEPEALHVVPGAGHVDLYDRVASAGS